MQCANTHVHTHTHARTHARAHIHAHAHTHTHFLSRTRAERDVVKICLSPCASETPQQHVSCDDPRADFDSLAS